MSDATLRAALEFAPSFDLGFGPWPHGALSLVRGTQPGRWCTGVLCLDEPLDVALDHALSCGADSERVAVLRVALADPRNGCPKT